MCDYCKPVLGSCVSAHNLEKCVLKRSLYCLKCHNYGHCVNECNLSYKNSMVLGDELCSGTETTSGVAIVATTMQTW